MHWIPNREAHTQGLSSLRQALVLIEEYQIKFLKINGLVFSTLVRNFIDILIHQSGQAKEFFPEKHPWHPNYHKKILEAFKEKNLPYFPDLHLNFRTRLIEIPPPPSYDECKADIEAWKPIIQKDHWPIPRFGAFTNGNAYRPPLKPRKGEFDELEEEIIWEEEQIEEEIEEVQQFHARLEDLEAFRRSFEEDE